MNSARQSKQKNFPTQDKPEEFQPTMHNAPDNRQEATCDQLAAHANRSILTLTGLAIGIALVVASMFPLPLMPAVLSQILLAVALGTSAVATISAQRPLESHLNLWDTAMLLTFSALVAGSFTDPAALTAFFEAQASIEEIDRGATPPAQ